MQLSAGKPNLQTTISLIKIILTLAKLQFETSFPPGARLAMTENCMTLLFHDAIENRSLSLLVIGQFPQILLSHWSSHPQLSIPSKLNIPSVFIRVFVRTHGACVFCYWLGFLPSLRIESVNWGSTKKICIHWPMTRNVTRQLLTQFGIQQTWTRRYRQKS